MSTTYMPQLTREQEEARRLAAAKDLEDGELTQTEIAEKYGVTPGAVSAWKSRLEREGLDGLKARPVSGRPPKLDDDQLAKLERILLDGALSYGFESDLWTGPRVARVIEEVFGVTYHEKYVPQLLGNRLGFSYQKPERVARERDDEQRKQWLDTTWKELKKGRSRADG